MIEHLKLDIYKKYEYYHRLRGHSDTGCGCHIPRPQPSDFAVIFFNGMNSGTFLDVGACDGIRWSNTLTLEEGYGWSGICVEPHPKSYEELVKHRNAECLNIGLSDESSSLVFCMIDGWADVISGFTKFYCENHQQRVKEETKRNKDTVSYINIESKKISEILEERDVCHLNYLSIDTEGSELQVLKGANLSKNTFDLISCENNYGRSDVREYLNEYGYEFLTKVCGDEFYAPRSNLTTRYDIRDSVDNTCPGRYDWIRWSIDMPWCFGGDDD